MPILLRTFAFVVLAAMLAVTGWASSVQALWKIPPEVHGNPWFIATRFDAYFGFLTFWLWIAWKEKSWQARIGWLVAVLLLGNIAMAVYLLIQVRGLPAGASVERLLLRRHD